MPNHHRRIRLAPLTLTGLLALIAIPVHASKEGVSLYLPVNLAPDNDREIEAFLLEADVTVMKRPIPVRTLETAYERLCKPTVRNPRCGRIGGILARYSGNAGIGLLSGEWSTRQGAHQPEPNAHGQELGTSRLNAQVWWQPGENFALAGGGIASSDASTPIGTLMSFGNDAMQVDVGFKDRWYSPFSDSAMLGGSNARALPSVSLGNVRPLTDWNIDYELSLTRMGVSDNISWNGGSTQGNPQLVALHVGANPTPGWAIGVTRYFQTGGGDRGFRLKNFLGALYNPGGNDNANSGLSSDQELGNQQAAISTRFLLPGPVPASLYFEYAGEDTSNADFYRLGNTALSAGVHIPRFLGGLEIQAELTEWQNGWYVHHVYQDGVTFDNRVLGHWGADAGKLDNVGGISQFLRIRMPLDAGQSIEAAFRGVLRDDYGSTRYDYGRMLSLRYSFPMGQQRAGLMLAVGQDVFGERFAALGGSLTLDAAGRSAEKNSSEDSNSARSGSQWFITAGLAQAEEFREIEGYAGDSKPYSTWSPHYGIGFRRPAGTSSDIGVRIESERINGIPVLALRALDYRYRLSGNWALTGFLGAARYQVETPAHGWYLGGGVQRMNVVTGWDLNLEYRYFDNIQRDRLYSTEPALANGQTDMFYHARGVILSVARNF